MDSFRPQKSPGSDRFLGLLSTSPPSASSASFEFDEHEIFSTDTDSNPVPNPSSPYPLNPSPSRSPLSPFYRERNFGILAALPEEESGTPNPKFLQRKPSISSAHSPSPSSAARVIPVIPKPRAPDYASKMGHHQFQSAPVNVPVAHARLGSRTFSLEKGDGVGEEEEEEEEDDETVLPPHEIVDRAQGKGEPMTTFSVLEGVGRTLKGRDLRRVRNAVWHKTGFLD